MMHAVAAALARELASVRAELAAYPDDASCFADVPGLPNSGGTLALHCAGNLRHFIGHVLGGSGYARDRAREFAARDVPRAQVDAELEAAEREVASALARFDVLRFDAPWPGELPGGAQYSVRQMLQHLTSHVAYHLGQMDYHRRMVTGDARSVGAMSSGALGHMAPPMRAEVVYEVTATVRADLMAAYVAWLTPGHVQDVVATGCFRFATVTQLGETLVRVAYVAESRAEIDRYLQDFAPALRGKGLTAFPDGVVWSREIGEIVERT
jgi:uncharacterized damage-inducible protein DinB